MPLVEPLPLGADPETAELATFFNTTLGFAPNSVLTMQRRPEIARAFIALNKAVMANHGRITSEQKRLVALIASQAAGCLYCQAHTALAAERFGASQARIEALWTYQRSDLFTDAEKADIKNILKSPTFSQTLYPTLYWEQISQWSSKSNLNSALVIGLIRQESRFESQIVSSAEAVGLMQIIPDTAAWIAGKKGVKNYNLRNPEQNVEFGTWYLDYTHREFGNNTMLALASYNAGPGRVKQWVNSFGVNDPEEFIERIPYDETRGYVRQVLGNYWNYLRLYSPQIQQQITQIN